MVRFRAWRDPKRRNRCGDRSDLAPPAIVLLGRDPRMRVSVSDSCFGVGPLLGMERARRKRRIVESSSSRHRRAERLPLADVTGELERLGNRHVGDPAERGFRKTTSPLLAGEHPSRVRARKPSVSRSASACQKETSEPRDCSGRTDEAATVGVGTRNIQRATRTSTLSGSESDKSAELVSLSTPTSTEEELVTFERRFRGAHASPVFKATVPISGPDPSNSRAGERSSGAPAPRQAHSKRRQTGTVGRRCPARFTDASTGGVCTPVRATLDSSIHSHRAGRVTRRSHSSDALIPSPVLATGPDREQVLFWEQVDQDELLVEDITSSVTSADRLENASAVDS